MNQIIENALNSEDLTAKINNSAPLKIKIKQELRKDMKEVEGTYVQKMIDLTPEIAKIQAKKKKERSEEEWEKYENFVKTQRKKFKAIKKSCPIQREDGSIDSPLVKTALKLAETCKMLAYLEKDEEIKKVLADNGITLSFEPLEKTNDKFASEDVKEQMKYIFSSAEEIESQIREAKKEIKENYYNLDPAIKFSKEDPRNLEGLKPAQFEKLVNQRAISLTKSSQKYTEYREKILETAKADIVSMEMTMEKSRDM